MFFKKITTKHLSASLTKHSIINFEKRPSKTILKDYLKNSTNSIFAKEIFDLLNKLKVNKTIKTIRVSSFLLNDTRGNTVINIFKEYGANCYERNINFSDIFSFIAVSIITLNIKNLKRISWKIKECKIIL
jgi:hypothetical protein